MGNGFKWKLDIVRTNEWVREHPEVVKKMDNRAMKSRLISMGNGNKEGKLGMYGKWFEDQVERYNCLVTRDGIYYPKSVG